MKLGILVNSDKNLAGISGLTEAARAKKHQVTLFIMDSGTHLLEDSKFTSLAGLEGVDMSYCDHSAQELGVITENLPEKIVRSSQYNNAEMNHNMDKVIVL